MQPFIIFSSNAILFFDNISRALQIGEPFCRIEME